MADEDTRSPAESQNTSDLGIGPTINIADEYGTAKRNLPPARVVLIVIAALAVVAGVFSFVQRAQPQGVGSLDYVDVAEMPGQKSVMVAATLTLRNSGKKALYIHEIKGALTTSDGKKLEDVAASAVDFERYYQALPNLKEHAIDPLLPETKLSPGEQKKGTVIVSFPVDRSGFDSRQSFKVVIQPYDQPVAIELGK
jgi:hypothetical protein